MFVVKKILTIMLLVLTLGSLIAGKWVGPFLSKILGALISSPTGAIFTALALIVFVAVVINTLLNLVKIKG